MTVFYPIAGFPRVTGAIDGSLIPIWSPDSDEHLSVCHKGFHAINVMTVCNAHLSSTNFVCIWHGSVHDSTIFNASYLQACMEGEGGGNGWLLGDCGYAIKPYRYQKAHTKMKNTTERAFGLWKTRFPSMITLVGSAKQQISAWPPLLNSFYIT